jgi:BirA family biotin operon repressor/biotin-[acetyl-CoA-carboxylase] ligase
VSAPLGRPRLHVREIDSTNARARVLAEGGAPHGTLVTTGFQTAGRGRQGRIWIAPPDRALLLSLVIRAPDPLLPLRAGLAVADLAGPDARVKWPNDVLLQGGKVAGVLAEGRPQDGWAVLGIGVNVAVPVAELPPGAATLGRPSDTLEATLQELLRHLAARLDEPSAATVAALRARDALLDQSLRWAGGTGVGAGIAADGALRVRLPDGGERRLDAGEVHLLR